MNYIDYEFVRLYLEDIREYVNAYLYWLCNPIEDFDYNEMNTHLSSIPEIVDILEDKIGLLYEQNS